MLSLRQGRVGPGLELLIKGCDKKAICPSVKGTGPTEMGAACSEGSLCFLWEETGIFREHHTWSRMNDGSLRHWGRWALWGHFGSLTWVAAHDQLSNETSSVTMGRKCLITMDPVLVH